MSIHTVYFVNEYSDTRPSQKIYKLQLIIQQTGEKKDDLSSLSNFLV